MQNIHCHFYIAPQIILTRKTIIQKYKWESYGPLKYAFSYFHWRIPFYIASLVLEKVEFPIENQYLSTFQIPKKLDAGI